MLQNNPGNDTLSTDQKRASNKNKRPLLGAERPSLISAYCIQDWERFQVLLLINHCVKSRFFWIFAGTFRGEVISGNKKGSNRKELNEWFKKRRPREKGAPA
jgi:hypothetical protein